MRLDPTEIQKQRFGRRIGRILPRAGKRKCCFPGRKRQTKVTFFKILQLAYFKVPRYWLFKDSFPTTLTGKWQKDMMRNMAVQELSLKTLLNC